MTPILKTRSTGDDTQTQPEPTPALSPRTPTKVVVSTDGTAPARDDRGLDVRRKYDFSVIRALRHQKGLTIEKFAKVCGLSYAPISRIETNLIKPNLDTLDKIAEGLGIATHSLVALAEKREAEIARMDETRSGGFTFRTVIHEAVELVIGSARKGAVTGDLDIRRHQISMLAVRAGIVQVKVNEKLHKVVAGDVLHFESTLPHQLTALEDVDVVLVHHPRR